MNSLPQRIKRIPRAVVWNITERCNMRCTHCETNSGKQKKGELDTLESLSLADDLAKAGCKLVNLAGGEPLMRKDWPEISKKLDSLKIEVIMVSNGIAIDEEMISQMKYAGVSGVSVSIDGEQTAHDSIRKTTSRLRRSAHSSAIRATELLAASSLKTAVITQVSKRSFPDLDAVHERLERLEVDNWQIQLAMPYGRTLKLKKEYLLEPNSIPGLLDKVSGFIETSRINVTASDNLGYYTRHEPVLRRNRGRLSFWHGCLAGIQAASIGATGDVKGCPALPDQFASGNIRETSFADIWKNEDNFAYNTAFCEDDLEGGCAECAFGKICRGGCTAMAYAVTGTVYDNPFCAQRSHQDETCP
jgi:radical SAM protein with 4Fe4S-binding SPASM domain